MRALSRRVLGLSIESDKFKKHKDNLLMQLEIVCERAKRVHKEKICLLKKLNTIIEVMPKSTPEIAIKMEHKGALDMVDTVGLKEIMMEQKGALDMINKGSEH